MRSRRRRRDHFGVVVLGVLLQRRPEEQVFARDVDAQFLDVGLAGDLLGQGVAQRDVFQAAVARFLQVAVVGGAQRAASADGQRAAQSGPVCVGVVLRPAVGVLPRQAVSVGAVVLSPEEPRLAGGIPVAFADALEEDREVDAVPVCAEVDAVVIARRGVADLAQGRRGRRGGCCRCPRRRSRPGRRISGSPAFHDLLSPLQKVFSCALRPHSCASSSVAKSPTTW